MSSFCTAKATHSFFSKKFQHICISLDVNFNESLTNDVVSFEQLGPEKKEGSFGHTHQIKENSRLCFSKSYRIYPKYSDTSTPYHICSKI